MIRKLFIVSTITLFFSCGETTVKEQISEAPEESVVEENGNCNCEDLIHDNLYNWYYLEDRKSPFSGKCSVNYTNGNVKLEREFVEGKVHGTAKEWFENGQQKLLIEFDMNLQSGEKKEWDETGKLIYHANYKRGELDTIYTRELEVVTG